MRTKLGRIAAAGVAAVIAIGSLTVTTALPVAAQDATVPSTVPDTTPTTTGVPMVADVDIPAERGTGTQATETVPPPVTTTTLPPTALPANSGTGRRVVYSKPRQRLWTVNGDGTVERTYLISGRLTYNQPSPGTYSVFSKSLTTCNIKKPYLCWRYMVRFTKGPDGDNIGFHEIPVDTRTGQPVQTLSQLGQPLSNGCIRQAPADALYMWNWAGVGTKVVVLG